MANETTITKNIRMQQLKKDESGKNYYETMHPETVAKQVLYDGKKIGAAGINGAKYTTTEGALDNIVDNLNNNIDGVSQAHIKLGELEAKINELGQAVVVQDRNDFYNNADNRAKYDFYDDKTAYRVGTQVLIEDTGTPDYWISSIYDTSEDFNSDNYPTGSIYIRVGYYGLSILEYAIDLAPYQKKSDGALNTAEKDIVPAINEVNEIAISANAGMNNNAATLGKIVSGEQYIQNANYAATAEAAGTAITAKKLESSVGISVTGDDIAEDEAMFDGSGDATLTVNLKPTGVTTGTYSAVTVDAKGRVTAGSQFIEIGTDIDQNPSGMLAVNGIFFRRVS